MYSCTLFPSAGAGGAGLTRHAAFEMRKKPAGKRILKGEAIQVGYHFVECCFPTAYRAERATVCQPRPENKHYIRCATACLAPNMLHAT